MTLYLIGNLKEDLQEDLGSWTHIISTQLDNQNVHIIHFYTIFSCSWWEMVTLCWMKAMIPTYKRPFLSHNLQQSELGPLHTGDWQPVTIARTHSHWWKRQLRIAHTEETESVYVWSGHLIGGKGRAGPSLHYSMLEGPPEWVCECKMDVKSTWIPTWHQMDHVSWSLGLFSKTTSWR